MQDIIQDYKGGKTMLEINKIHLGDSYELIKEITDNSVDLVIIDPPYNFEHGGKMTGLFRDRGTRHFDALEGKNLTLNYDYKTILDELLRVMKFIYIYIWCNKQQIKQYHIHTQINMYTNTIKNPKPKNELSIRMKT